MIKEEIRKMSDYRKWKWKKMGLECGARDLGGN